MRKKLCKMLVVVVVVVFGRISTLVSLATRSPKLIKLTKREGGEADVCQRNARNQVHYTARMMQRISSRPFSVLVNASRLKHVVISNILILEHSHFLD